MRWNALPNATLGYCTNVHPGRTLDEVKSQLERHAVAVKRQVCPGEPLGVGLWFSADVANELDPAVVGNGPAWDLKRWLEGRGLACFTLNGFPYGHFHGDVVKHAVYAPNWTDPQRRDYTLALIRILDALLPAGKAGSISTLPIGWTDTITNLDDPDAWIDPLLDVVDALAQLEAETGRLIHLNLEPEPGCYVEDTITLDTAIHDLEVASDRHDDLRRYLRVCLDVCHAAVMFEPADHLLKWCRRTGYRVGKVQLSSAVRIRFEERERNDDLLQQRWEELERLAEPRYLHQTTWGHPSRHRRHAFFGDLREAIDAHEDLTHPDEWRVHFHVPIHLESLDLLGTTQGEIIKLLRAIRPSDGIEHFEVETYAWDVLPEEHRPAELADGIAAELQWVRSLLQS